MQINANQNKQSISLVVMAAGIGSRYGGLKQMDPLGPAGEVIIDYSIFDAKRAGFDKLVLIIRRDIEKDFRDQIGRILEKQIDTEYVFQELTALPNGLVPPAGRTKPWGTTQAVLSAAKVTKSPFAIINADDFYGAGAYKILADFLATVPTSGSVAQSCNIGYVVDNTLSENGHVARGVCATDAKGFLTGIVERKKIQPFADGIKFTEDDVKWEPIPSGTLVSMNMWGFTPAIFPLLQERFESFLKTNATEQKAECLLPSEIGNLITAGKVATTVLRTEEKWFGVTYREDKSMVEKAVKDLIEGGKYPGKLWK